MSSHLQWTSASPPFDMLQKMSLAPQLDSLFLHWRAGEVLTSLRRKSSAAAVEEARTHPTKQHWNVFRRAKPA